MEGLFGYLEPIFDHFLFAFVFLYFCNFLVFFLIFSRFVAIFFQSILFLRPSQFSLVCLPGTHYPAHFPNKPVSVGERRCQLVAGRWRWVWVISSKIPLGTSVMRCVLLDVKDRVIFMKAFRFFHIHLFACLTLKLQIWYPCCLHFWPPDCNFDVIFFLHCR